MRSAELQWTGCVQQRYYMLPTLLLEARTLLGAPGIATRSILSTSSKKLLIAMPFVTSSFLLLVVRPGAPSSFLLLVVCY